MHFINYQIFIIFHYNQKYVHSKAFISSSNLIIEFKSSLHRVITLLILHYSSIKFENYGFLKKDILKIFA